MVHKERCDCMADTNSKSRKRVATTVNPDIWQNFKVACVKSQLDMNDVLELLMQAYSDGVIKLEDISE